MDKISVIVFEPPGTECEYREIDNTLEAMQEIVGGYIEVVPLCNKDDEPIHGIVLVCNEEGKLKGLPDNIKVWGDPIKGTCFICRTDGEEFASI